jgi:hypothetical protein
MRSAKRYAISALIGPPVAGATAWAVTGQWRWPITGLVVGVALLAVAIAVAAFLDSDPDAGGPGCILSLLVLFILGPLFGLAMWLWTENPYWGLAAGLTPLLGLIVIGAIFSVS